MIQRHTILLWKAPDDREFHWLATEAYHTLEVLMKYDKICYPKYKTTMNKKKAEPIEWSYV